MTTFPQPSTESAIAAGNLPKFALLPGKHDIRLLCKQFYFFHLSILEDLYKTSILPADLSPPYKKNPYTCSEYFDYPRSCFPISCCGGRGTAFTQ